jgi:hypothetical protein
MKHLADALLDIDARYHSFRKPGKGFPALKIKFFVCIDKRWYCSSAYA